LKQSIYLFLNDCDRFDEETYMNITTEDEIATMLIRSPSKYEDLK